MQLTKWMAAGAAALMSVSALAADPLKIGFVYVGPVSDGGWTYEHNVGRLAVEAEYGDKVETTFVESVSEGPDAERVITQLAQSHDMVFTTSFGYMNPTVKVAKRFPNVKFEHATGFKRAENVATYGSRFYEGRAVIGTIAGEMTKTDTIGYIASFPIPEVVRGINAAYLAAKKVNPNVKMKIVWVNSWFDPGKEGDAAKALIDQGADVLMQHTDSGAPMQIAEQQGIFAFGQASNMANFGPNAQLSGIIDDWAPYYVQQVGKALDGSWSSTDTWGGFNTGMVALAPFGAAVPAELQARALEVRDNIANGTLHPFTGPINKQDGSAWLADGEVADDGTLLGMGFYVEGIDGVLPQ
ncbi:BMP family ABC transporter substrate-binding protein [Litorivicinus lipolyticus]|uniref:BMP family ABC transporter substrate-binding protein n=3 Tax=Litorivicinus lipolyticus TaxID=418701 RepID=A0A5Q2QH17_9GAMM|nr:BMP family ABC transporter substrate-binding protein [Litorivicinus lipolyticus]QGG81140.1 BMP family ABC transporter substrate-binding protein [Litorivicinus lipolyticus]